MSSESLKVRIQSPSFKEAISIDTDMDATVKSLKDLIHTHFPGNTPPKPEDQRIIYNGKLLDNDTTLRTVMEKSSTTTLEPTFHVVIKPSLNQFPKPPAMASRQAVNSRSELMESASNVSTQADTGTSPFTPTLSPALPGGYQLVFIDGQYFLAPVLVPAFDTAPTPSAEALQYAASLRHRHPTTPPRSGVANTFAQPAPAPEPIPAPVQAAMAQQQNAARAASVWLGLKLVFILFFICQGASIERILIFHVIAVVFFLYQTGRLRVVVRRVRQADMDQNAPHHGGPIPERPGTPIFPHARQEGEEASHGSPVTAEPQGPVTVLDVVKRGAYTFVASLWPNYGRDPRIAQAFENGQQDPMGGF